MKLAKACLLGLLSFALATPATACPKGNDGPQCWITGSAPHFEVLNEGYFVDAHATMTCNKPVHTIRINVWLVHNRTFANPLTKGPKSRICRGPILECTAHIEVWVDCRTVDCVNKPHRWSTYANGYYWWRGGDGNLHKCDKKLRQVKDAAYGPTIYAPRLKGGTNLVDNSASDSGYWLHAHGTIHFYGDVRKIVVKVWLTRNGAMVKKVKNACTDCHKEWAGLQHFENCLDGWCGDTSWSTHIDGYWIGGAGNRNPIDRLNTKCTVTGAKDGLCHCRG